MKKLARIFHQGREWPRRNHRDPGERWSKERSHDYVPSEAPSGHGEDKRTLRQRAPESNLVSHGIGRNAAWVKGYGQVKRAPGEISGLACWVALCLPLLAWGAGERVDIARFSQGDLSGWQTKVFAGETRYSLASTDGRPALRADSSAAASGLYREISVDLGKTPILNWSWKVDHVLAGADERTRAGDDYPARVYVVFSGGLIFWRTRAINYVWSNRQPIGSIWPNAFTGNARMIAVESGAGRAGAWIDERRDVRADYRCLFGEDPSSVDAVAIMTDTDNTGAAATAWYGDIWFTAE